MSEMSSDQCTYTYTSPEELTGNDRVAVERPKHEQCPHAAVDADTGRCIYHHGEGDYPGDRFTDRFTDTLEQDNISPTFAGGQLPGLDLRGQTITTATGDPLDLRGVVIDGDLDLTNATVEVPLLLDGAAITGSLLVENAKFRAPLSLINADINRGVYGHEASIAGGLDAAEVSAGYVDFRAVEIDGALIIDQATFTSNLIVAHAAIDGDFSAEEAAFDWSLDATAVTVGGDFTLTEVSIDAALDVVAAEIDGKVELRKGVIKGEVDWSHSTIGADFVGSDCRFEADAIFDDIALGGEAMVFDRAEFGGTADFATSTLSESRVAFTDAEFTGEVWFTHTTIGELADFSGAVFEGMSHLRDAVFQDELVLQNIETTEQFFLHGSVVEGELDTTDSSFEHFQFSATVEGKADFSRATFVEKAIFKSSTFGDRVWFDDASFAGHADFSDTRFTGKTTFERTEFLVDPTFTDARFAIDPDFSVAKFPFAEKIDFEDRRSRMILAHPDSLQNDGKQLSHDAVTGNVTIPAGAAHFVNNDSTRTKRVVKAISGLDRSAWHTLSDEPLRTARTAVAEVSATDEAILVFGLHTDETASSGSDFVTDLILAGVYTKQDESIIFGHLDTSFFDADYLIPIPASDDAFSSGAAVATASELQQAVIRNEMFRATALDKQEDTDGAIYRLLVPVLVGAGTP